MIDEAALAKLTEMEKAATPGIAAWLVLKDIDRENPRTELAFGPRREG